MSRLAALLLAAALAGCVSPAGREPPHYFVLQASGEPPKAAATRPGTLLVSPTAAADFYDTPQLVYSRRAGERGYYQLNRWTERPSRRIHDLVIQRLQASGAFRHVASSASGVRGDLVLATDLEELYHDAIAAPGSVRVTVSAALTDPSRRALVARRSFTRSAPVASYDADGAVAAFNQAVGALLDDIVAWVDAAAP